MSCSRLPGVTDGCAGLLLAVLQGFGTPNRKHPMIGEREREREAPP
jgi:hypothetical protein